MITSQDSQVVADFSKSQLDLENAELGDEYYYQSLPLCVIDTVFSIGVNYASTRNVVNRFCEHFALKRVGGTEYSQVSEQLSIKDFIKLYNEYGTTRMTEEVYQNRQRTSTRSGILKSEAVLKFSQVLDRYKVNYFQDVDKVIGNTNFEQEIREIPGQRSGISTRYFYMLAGSDNYIKPDRMMTRFIYSALNRKFNVEESHDVVVGAHGILIQEYPHLSLRSLDHLIWNYQRAL